MTLDRNSNANFMDMFLGDFPELLSPAYCTEFFLTFATSALSAFLVLYASVVFTEQRCDLRVLQYRSTCTQVFARNFFLRFSHSTAYSTVMRCICFHSVRIQRRDNKEEHKYPRHPTWMKLWHHLDDRDNTGCLIVSGFFRPDLQALRVFWVPHNLFYHPFETNTAQHSSQQDCCTGNLSTVH